MRGKGGSTPGLTARAVANSPARATAGVRATGRADGVRATGRADGVRATSRADGVRATSRRADDVTPTSLLAPGPLRTAVRHRSPPCGARGGQGGPRAPRTPCLPALAALVTLAASLTHVAPASADATLAPGPTGGLGAWLVAGPLAVARSKKAALSTDFALPEGVDTFAHGASAGAVVPLPRSGKLTWQVVASSSGSLDLRSALSTAGTEATAVAAGVLRLSAPFRGYLLLGVDDGVSVFVDGQRVFERDVARSAHPDDELIALDLPPGDHPVFLKLHQRGGSSWTLRLRVTDRSLAPARGVSLVLPGEVDASKLATDLLDMQLDRGLTPDGLRPELKLTGRGGWPRGEAASVRVTARTTSGGEVFAAPVGGLGADDDGPFWGLTARLPALTAADLGADGEVRFAVDAGPVHRTLTASARSALRATLGRARAARELLAKNPSFVRDVATADATLEALSDRLAGLVDRGDPDITSQLDEAAALAQFAEAIEQGKDPFAAIHGARRLAYRSPLDGHPSTFALYVPTRLEPNRRYPLVVALHGLNGKPMNMLRWVFGHDDPNHDGEWEDRHPGDFPDYPAIVVAPMARFNSMYRHAAEDDVMAVVDWASRMYPVDPHKVSITGPSMGGTGTAWVAFRYPDRFAAAAPLCGYHYNYFLRAPAEFARLAPWEQHQAEERSTVEWAANGLHLPLYVVHGTKDLPVENSGVLIDRYKKLGYSLREEHPDEGHNVWQPTYEDLQGLGWLTGPTRAREPSRVVLRTDSLRYDHADWVKITRLERSSAWGEVRAQRRSRAGKPSYELTTSGVTALTLTPPTAPTGPTDVTLDGTKLTFDEGEPLAASRQQGRWERGTPPLGPGLHKHARLAGPLRDVHHEPLVLVYGTADPTLRRANEEVARWFGTIRPGFDIDYPVVADTELTDEMARGKALVLVGGAQSNLVTRRLDDRLPIHVTSSPPSVRAGDRTFQGDELGAAFVYPNPEQPEQYVVVLAGADVPGTLRAMSLPDLTPDFVVYDRGLAPARGQMVLGRATTRLAGLFDEHWALPTP